jgi:dolichol-phosphate mannosyltransferase
MNHPLLILIPTYNELGNVTRICEQILQLGIAADIHFIDDDSPDGTGQELDRLSSLHPGVSVTHRTGKLGIGSAHQEGISYAYRRGYPKLITMDCDFTHDPAIIPKLLEFSGEYDVVLGSRYMLKSSLKGWTFTRRCLSRLAHFLTRTLLCMKHDATGAFRCYRIDRIPHQLFLQVRSKSYPFFFESVFLLMTNGYTIKEIPIALPPRVQGVSKMSFFEPFRGVIFLFSLSLESLMSPHKFRSARKVKGHNEKSV